MPFLFLFYNIMSIILKFVKRLNIKENYAEKVFEKINMGNLLTTNICSHIIKIQTDVLLKEVHTMKVTRMKIKDINRFRVFCFLVFFFAVIFMQNKFLYSYNYPKTQYVTIQEGDSLWSIAQKHKAKYDDTRDFVERIKEMNMLEDSEITKGQEIKVPVTESVANPG